jgi:hypothetical protein
MCLVIPLDLVRLQVLELYLCYLREHSVVLQGEGLQDDVEPQDEDGWLALLEHRLFVEHQDCQFRVPCVVVQNHEGWGDDEDFLVDRGFLVG